VPTSPSTKRFPTSEINFVVREDGIASVTATAGEILVDIHATEKRPLPK
jgi:hypothetical protein